MHSNIYTRGEKEKTTSTLVFFFPVYGTLFLCTSSSNNKNILHATVNAHNLQYISRVLFTAMYVFSFPCNTFVLRRATYEKFHFKNGEKWKIHTANWTNFGGYGR